MQLCSTTVIGLVLVTISISHGRMIDVGQINADSIDDAEDALTIMRIISKPRSVSAVSVRIYFLRT
jgi:hypothetical protein